MKNIKAYLHFVIKQTLIWSVIFTIWFVLRNVGLDLNSPKAIPNFFQWIRVLVPISISAGILFGSIAFAIEKVLLRKMPFGMLALFSSVIFLIAIVIVISIGAKSFIRVMEIETHENFLKEFLMSTSGLLFIAYCFFAGFFVDIVKEIDKKFGPGNLWRMIKGEFYRPKEDERIFMFLDLKSSTHYAEVLGHLKFSQLIQDCFKDLDVVFAYGAEVYQYVGDEVILSWGWEKGLSNGNCLRAFFAFTDQLKNRSDYYNSKYGFVPEFKAGINGGKITVAEVGEVKREIAFHGDVLNTAARIQGKCNELGEKLLITENMMRNLDQIPYDSKEVGKVQLRGKASDLLVFSINQN